MSYATQIFAPVPVRPEVLNVRLSADELAVVDREAAKLGVSRSDLVRAALGRWVAQSSD